MLYTPPVSLEQLGARLQVSVVSSTPRVAQGAFVSRMGTLDSTLDRSTLQSLWRCIDPQNVGSIELSALHALLADRYVQLVGSWFIQ